MSDIKESELNENLKIWSHADKVDPEYTKKNDNGGFDSFSLNGYWIFKKATELFGPLGKGWGYDICEERFDQGADIWHVPSLKTENPISLGKTVNHTIKLKLWYIQEGEKKCSFEHFGTTPYVYQTKYGLKTDGEAVKKSLTDAIKKALSMLGFAGDVYLGEYEKREYLEAIKTEFEIEKSESKDAVVDEKRQELIGQINKVLASIESARTVTEISGMKKAALRSLDRQKKITQLSEVAKRGMAAIDQASRKKALLLTPESTEENKEES